MLLGLMYYRPILSEYGIWDQIWVDQGKEWVLMQRSFLIFGEIQAVTLIFNLHQNRLVTNACYNLKINDVYHE